MQEISGAKLVRFNQHSRISSPLLVHSVCRLALLYVDFTREDRIIPLFPPGGFRTGHSSGDPVFVSSDRPLVGIPVGYVRNRASVLSCRGYSHCVPHRTTAWSVDIDGIDFCAPASNSQVPQTSMLPAPIEATQPSPTKHHKFGPSSQPQGGRARRPAPTAQGPGSEETVVGPSQLVPILVLLCTLVASRPLYS